jgi:phosphoribosylaminoimidazole-succinocarboxamide synthase
MTSHVVSATEFKTLKLKGRGKVRDIYDLGDKLLIVASDRISAFDVVMPNPIPDKGRVLTQLSSFWFELTKDIVLNERLSEGLPTIQGNAGRPFHARYENRGSSNRVCG